MYYLQPLQLTSTLLSLKPLEKTSWTTPSCCFSIIPGVVANIRKAHSRMLGSGDWLAWKRAASNSGQLSSSHGQLLRPSYMPCSPSYVPLSVYCLAISAMASPILFRTWLTCSVARHWSICCLIAILASLLRVKNRSLDSFVSKFFLDFEACFRKRTAANDRAYILVRSGSPITTYVPY
jgi:hypothetical protein